MTETVVQIPDPTNSEIQYYAVVRITGLENTDASVRYESGNEIYHFYKTANEKATLAVKGFRLYADADESTTYVTLKSPTSITTSYSLLLPTTAPAVNQTLVSDASGNLSWANAGFVASGSGTTNALAMFNSSGALADVGVLTDGQIVIGRTGLSPVAGSIAGTTNQVNVTTGAGTITLSLPQSIAAASSPTFAGLTLTSFSGIVKATAGVLSASALVNADVSASAAIAYSKLNLSASIVNADVSASAAIARSKLATGTASHVVINDGSGAFSSEAQLAVSRGGTGIASYAVGDLLYASGSGTLAKLGIGSTGQVLKVSGGVPTWAAAGGGDVTGPASSTDNAVAIYDSTTGKILKNSGVRVTGTGAAVDLNIDAAAAQPATLNLRANNGSNIASIRGKADGTIEFYTAGLVAGTVSLTGVWDLDALTIAGITVPTISSTSTLTNKTIDAANNTLSNISNIHIAAAAGIEGSKLQAASELNAGAVTTTTQTFAGDKIFTGATTIGNSAGSGQTHQIIGNSKLLLGDGGTLTVKNKADSQSWFDLANDGAVTVKNMHNGPTSSNPRSGTNTPTIVSVTNVAASTAYSGQFMRVGDVVTFSARVDIDPTASGGVEFDVTLPISSNFTATNNAAGTWSANDGGFGGGIIRANSTNDRLTFIGKINVSTNTDCYFTVTYVVL